MENICLDVQLVLNKQITVQSQQYKQYKKMFNIFKDNNKISFLNDYIVDFVQVNICWVASNEGM